MVVQKAQNSEVHMHSKANREPGDSPFSAEFVESRLFSECYNADLRQ